LKILFDQCLADDLKKSLPGHEVVFSRQLNWAELSNGQLIDAAEAAGFDVMITSDKNLKYQQNLSNRRISIIVLSNNYWPEVQRHLAEIVTAVEAAKPNSFQEIPMLTRREFLRSARES
jgi:hypothetical protein